MREIGQLHYINQYIYHLYINNSVKYLLCIFKHRLQPPVINIFIYVIYTYTYICDIYIAQKYISESRSPEPNLDRNYTFLNDLTPNEIPVRAKSFGKKV